MTTETRGNWLTSRFARITSSNNYVPEIDGIRFVAIFFVFLFHAAGDILRHSPAGYAHQIASNPVFWTTQVLNIGVQLFFVLSGYVLSAPFASQYLQGGRSVGLKRYFMRRVTRLEPPYIASLILFLLLKLLGGRGSLSELWPHFLASAGYLHNLIYAGPSDINFVAWSLEIEVQFYILAPLFAFLLFQTVSPWKRRTIICAACLGAACISLLPSSPRIDLSLAGQLPYFLAGFLLADLETSRRNLVENGKRGLLWDFVAISAFVLLFYWIRIGNALLFLGPLTIAGSYWASFQSLWVKRFLRNPIVSTIGGMCYSIYLLHNYVIASFGQFTERLSATLPFDMRLIVQAAVLGPIVLIISGIFFALVERPCMRPDWPARLANWIRSSGNPNPGGLDTRRVNDPA